MEKGKTRLKFQSHWPSLDVSAGLLGVSLGLDIFDGSKRYLPTADGRYLLATQNCLDKTDHYDFEVREGENTGSFVIVSRSESISLLVYLASPTHVNYPMSEKKKPSNLL